MAAKTKTIDMEITDLRSSCSLMVNLKMMLTTPAH